MSGRFGYATARATPEIATTEIAATRAAPPVHKRMRTGSGRAAAPPLGPRFGVESSLSRVESAGIEGWDRRVRIHYRKRSLTYRWAAGYASAMACTVGLGGS